MKSDRLNRWLTLGANLGVLVGIILLIIELDQNQDMLQAQMVQARADNRLATYIEGMHSDYWPLMNVKRAEADSVEDWISALTPEEYQRVRFQVLYEINDLRSQWYQYTNGNLDPYLFETSGTAQSIRMLQKLPFFPDLRISSRDFVEYLNEIARKSNLPEVSDETPTER